MSRMISLWVAAMWLATSGAFGRGEAEYTKGRIRFESGNPLSVSFAQEPVRVSTVAGSLSFLPSELAEVGFPAPGKCVVTTVHQDRWVLDASPQILRPLVVNAKLNDMLDRVREFIFLSSTTTDATQVEASWMAELTNFSLVHFVPDEADIRMETPAGKIDVPVGMVESLQVSPTEEGLQAQAELSPGGYAIQGLVLGSALRGKDLGGRRIVLPWPAVGRLARTDRKPVAFTFRQEVASRMSDGQEMKGSVPVSVLTVDGRGGTWALPTTRILQMEKNPDGTYSIQTTVGEWLSGSVTPRGLPILVNGTATNLLFSNCASVKWTNAPEEMPSNSLAWRLKTGDLLVGEWQADPLAAPEAAPASLRVKNTDSAPAFRLPVQVNGKWTVSRFNVMLWASGTLLKWSAADVEAVGTGPVRQMPPAVWPRGPSAVRSDEILMPGGSFRMGRNRGDGPVDEIPPVDLSLESFWIANTPVTVAQFGAFVEDTGYVTGAERTPGALTWRSPGFLQRPEDPVVCVTWRETVRYCNWRSARAGLKPCYDIRHAGQEVVVYPERNGYRLPIEAEWEYAARSGGLDLTYPWGEEDREKVVAGLANFRLSGTGLDPWPWTSPVKAFSPSQAGIYDMGGNVWEWCQDLYQEDAYSSALRGEGMERLLNALPGHDDRRVMRGGSYFNTLEYLRCAARGNGVESMNAPRVGFRVVRNAETLTR